MYVIYNIKEQSVQQIAILEICRTFGDTKLYFNNYIVDPLDWAFQFQHVDILKH